MEVNLSNKKNKVIAAILVGHKNTADSYKEYKDMVMSKPDYINYEYDKMLNKKYGEFKIKLYNYVNAIKNKEDYFKNYYMIEEKINFVPEGSNGNNLYTLLSAFRHKNEHPENFEIEEKYILSMQCVLLETLEELFEISNYVLESELKTYDNDQLLQILVNNSELIMSFRKFRSQIAEKYNTEYEKCPEDYNEYHELMTKFCDFDFQNFNSNSPDEIMEIVNALLEKPNIKLMLSNIMSEELYIQFLEFTDISKDISLEDCVKIIEMLINGIISESTSTI